MGAVLVGDDSRASLKSNLTMDWRGTRLLIRDAAHHLHSSPVAYRNASVQYTAPQTPHLRAENDAEC